MFLIKDNFDVLHVKHSFYSVYAPLRSKKYRPRCIVVKYKEMTKFIDVFLIKDNFDVLHVKHSFILLMHLIHGVL